MKTEHTPGPWHLSNSSDLILDSEGNVLAYLKMAKTKEDGLLPMGANAHLMAAAPEMYDALRDLYNASVLQGMAFDMAWQKAITLYEELITKIEGDE